MIEKKIQLGGLLQVWVSFLRLNFHACIIPVVITYMYIAHFCKNASAEIQLKVMHFIQVRLKTYFFVMGVYLF